jgi:hypothetical protein
MENTEAQTDKYQQDGRIAVSEVMSEPRPGGVRVRSNKQTRWYHTTQMYSALCAC